MVSVSGGNRRRQIGGWARPDVLLVLPVEVDEGDTRVSLKDWGISSCWDATRGILAFCGEREHEVSVK